MLEILLIFALFLAIIIARKFFAERSEERLRDNPPEKRIVEVSLPGGIKDSRLQMKRFWKKMAKVAHTDSKGRKTGVGQIDLVYYITVPGPKAMPVLKCLIYADPDKMDAVKRAIKQVFDAQSDVLELAEDPLDKYADAIRELDHSESDPELLQAGAEQ